MKHTIKKAIYPGTFDPITNGHLDVIKKAAKMFDEVLIAVSVSADKNPLFNVKLRIEMIKKATESFSNIKVSAFDMLLVEYAKSKKINIVIRGLRAISDFEYELQMGYTNSKLSNEIITMYLMADIENSFISSSAVRTILKYGGRADKLVPSCINIFFKKF